MAWHYMTEQDKYLEQYADVVRQQKLDGARALAMSEADLGVALGEDDKDTIHGILSLIKAVDKAEIEAPDTARGEEAGRVQPLGIAADGADGAADDEPTSGGAMPSLGGRRTVRKGSRIKVRPSIVFIFLFLFSLVYYYYYLFIYFVLFILYIFIFLLKCYI